MENLGSADGAGTTVTGHKARPCTTAIGVDLPCHASPYAVAVDDNNWFLPNRPPPPRRQPKPGEPLWSVRRDHVTWSCELRYHGEWGVEAQILRNAELVVGRRFDTRALALQWAEVERTEWTKDGYERVLGALSESASDPER